MMAYITVGVLFVLAQLAAYMLGWCRGIAHEERRRQRPAQHIDATAWMDIPD